MKRPLLLACLVCLASCQRATVDENGARVVLAVTPRKTTAAGTALAAPAAVKPLKPTFWPFWMSSAASSAVSVGKGSDMIGYSSFECEYPRLADGKLITVDTASYVRHQTGQAHTDKDVG